MHFGAFLIKIVYMSVAIADARISHVTRRNSDFQYRVHYARSRAHKIIKVAYISEYTK